VSAEKADTEAQENNYKSKQHAYNMNIIIPMAGMGKRMRPHTLTTPKPLIPIAGKPMVNRIVEDIKATCNEPIETIAFICGRFGEEAENNLLDVAKRMGAVGKIFYQDTPLGTAHAILCAQEALVGPVFIAFADTLFDAKFSLDMNKDAIIWTHRVADPSAFGVVLLNEDESIHSFVEKPQDFISDMAIIGVYYFKDGENLRKELQYLLDNDIKIKGEYQITDAMENMRAKGMKFYTGEVDEWLDCGSIPNTLETMGRVLALKQGKENLKAASATISNSVIVEPCFIGENAVIHNSVIGPNVCIEAGAEVNESVVKNSIIRNNSIVNNAILNNSLIGSFAKYSSKADEASIGDYTEKK
jgi:glucose-1-phosphate thymidylyltransferase